MTAAKIKRTEIHFGNELIPISMDAIDQDAWKAYMRRETKAKQRDQDTHMIYHYNLMPAYIKQTASKLTSPHLRKHLSPFFSYNIQTSIHL